MCKTKVFLLKLIIVLYATDAKKNELDIFGPDGKKFTNSAKTYLNEDAIELFCKFTYVRSDFDLCWSEDGKVIEVDKIKINYGTNFITSNYTVKLNTGQNSKKVLCQAKEKINPPVTYNAYVIFEKHFSRKNTPNIIIPKEIVKNTNRTIVDRRVGLEFKDLIIYSVAGFVALLAMLIIILTLWKCCDKSRAEKRLVKSETNTTYENFDTITPGPVHVPVNYAAPVDRGETVGNMETYADPFVETNIELLYSKPLPKGKRNMKTTVEETTNDNLSYDYVVLSNAGSYCNVPHNNNSYTNDYSDYSGKYYYIQ